MALFGIACAVGGLFFPPLLVVAAVAAELSEVMLVGAVVLDVAVLGADPSLDNWVTVGADVVGIGVGYAVGKVVVGPALGALARRFGPAAGEAVTAEAEAALATEAKQAAQAEESAATRAAARRDALSRDPQNGKVNAKSVSEASTIMQAEEAGMVTNPRRPDMSKGEPNLDFAVDGPQPYKYCDVKTPVEPNKFPNTSTDTQAGRIAENIKAQKAGSKDVLHVVDLKNVPPGGKAEFKTKVLEKLGSGEGVEFLND